MTTKDIREIVAPRMGLLMLSVSFLFVLLLMPDFSEQIAFKKILINKSLQYVEKNEVDTLLEQALEKNFFSLELKDIAQSINNIPWVESAQVKKIWPDTILLNIEEQSPLARWGNEQLISVSGEVFSPGDLTEFAYLPRLIGKELQREEITDFYSQTQQILKNNDLNVVLVNVLSAFEWRVELESGLALILSSKQGLDKIRQFSDIYSTHIFPKLTDISHVDLRYDNGFVVAWQGEDEVLVEKSLALR